MTTLGPTKAPKLEQVRGGWRVRIRCGVAGQLYFTIALESQASAAKRADALCEMARDLVAAGKHVEAAVVLRKGAAQVTEVGFREVQAFAAELCAKAEAKAKTGTVVPSVTFQQLGERWTSGELASQHPDHVRLKRSVGDDVYRLSALYKTIGSVTLKDFTLSDAKRAMSAIPSGRTSATRRHYAQLIARVLKMAVFPCELIDRYPLPPGFLPKTGARPSLSYLYPAEDARLLACTLVPFELRLLYGFLAREGPRLGEALELRWRHVDLAHGTVRLERTKTGDTRAWALDPGTAEALSAARRARASEDESALVFPSAGPRPVKLFRAYLMTAGVSRPELFERTAHRRPIRLHDQRACFCTLSLAAGRSETWVMDRTGHATSQMLNKYRRQSRHAAELGLGWLVPLIEALPELAPTTEEEPCSPGQGVSHEVSHVSEVVPDFPAITVGRQGLEPWTYGLKVRSSTD